MSNPKKNNNKITWINHRPPPFMVLKCIPTPSANSNLTSITPPPALPQWPALEPAPAPSLVGIGAPRPHRLLDPGAPPRPRPQACWSRPPDLLDPVSPTPWSNLAFLLIWRRRHSAVFASKLITRQVLMPVVRRERREQRLEDQHPVRSGSRWL